MANTTIGNNFTIEGEITSEDNIVVQGTVKGKVETTQPIFVENSATIEADLSADSVEISGKVTGNISAKARVELKSDSKMIGDIQAPRILIADGALFKGNIDMDV